MAEAANKVASRFDWGFKGTHKLPEDYQSQLPRVVYTPTHWRHVGINRIGKDYALLHLYSRVAFTETELSLLEVDPNLPTLALTIEEALTNGEKIEKAYSKMLPVRKK